ncbi:hypothetical protein [Pseudoruegeria sp. HB172150]|uniref:hypothetical protein n=1 Tax=Pseudoruegeria sp. HB172150 TaxID=2721164 RepID=UPI0015516EB8|nr:hypothetical protein [Pseudoruegeria sp. HB172150]
MRRILIQSMFFLTCLAAPAIPQEATPDHVFQTTETVRLELELLNAANFSEVPEVSVPADPTRPRHVLQNARDVWRKLQLLRYMNGLDTRALAPLPSQEVTPSDVKHVVDQIQADVLELHSAYGIEEEIAVPAMPSGKTPADVYGNLLRISAQLDALGVPATVPNDVHRIAMTLRLTLQEIADAAGASYKIEGLWPESGRTPANVYSAAISLISDLYALAEKDSRFAVDGIAVPEAKKEGITPSDVILVLSRAMADAHAIKTAAGVGTPTRLAPPEGGRTPSDVFFVIKQSRIIVAALSGEESSLF